jgi:hypothetical protein
MYFSPFPFASPLFRSPLFRFEASGTWAAYLSGTISLNASTPPGGAVITVGQVGTWQATGNGGTACGSTQWNLTPNPAVDFPPTVNPPTMNFIADQEQFS